MHCTICGSENYNCQGCDQKPNANSYSEFPRENNNYRSFLFSGTESTWNSDYDKK